MPQGISNHDILLSRSHIMNILVTTKDKMQFEVPSGISVEYYEDLGFNSLNEIQDKYQMIIGGFELAKLDFKVLKQLKLVQLISAGYDYVNFDDCPWVKLANAKGVYSKAIAEWVLSALLMEIKGLRQVVKNQSNHKWERHIKSEDLRDKKILVFGTGSIGQEIAKIFQLFGINVDGVNSDGRSISPFNRTYAMKESLGMLRNYDVFVFCLPSTQLTSGFINQETVQLFKSDDIIINVGRGDLITKEAIHFRKDIRLLLDVIYQEPLSKENAEWEDDHVFISPHISFQSNENIRILKELIQINISNLYYDKEVVNRVK